MEIKVNGIIYCATNLINNKKYIGQTTRGIHQRKMDHKLCSKKGNSYFYHAIRKYGWDNFKWNILEDNINELTLLDDREQYWIKYYNTFIDFKNACGYNLTSGGNSAHILSKKSKLKLSKMRIGKLNAMYGVSPHNKGIPCTEEAKKNQSLKMKGRNIGKDNPFAREIEIYDIHMKLIERFDTIRLSAQWLLDIGICKTFNNARWAINEFSKSTKIYKQYYFKKVERTIQ